MIVTLKILLAYARIAFQRQFTYRAANISGLFTNVFFLLFRGFALAACFQNRSTIGGLTQADTLTYCTVSQALLMVVPAWGRVGLAEDVRSGQVAMGLCRPIGFASMYFAKRLGISFSYLFLRFPWVLCAGWLIGFLAPIQCEVWVFAISILLGSIIGNALLFLIEVSAFWLESERGVRYVLLGVSAVFCGLHIPLEFFPDSLIALSRWMPFEYGLYTPVRLYIGQVGDPLQLLGLQAAWAVGMLALCHLIYSRGLRSLTIQGG